LGQTIFGGNPTYCLAVANDCGQPAAVTAVIALFSGVSGKVAIKACGPIIFPPKLGRRRGALENSRETPLSFLI